MDSEASGAPSKINLYVGKTAVKSNIPEEEADGFHKV
jgi:hypothetical protein